MGSCSCSARMPPDRLLCATAVSAGEGTSKCRAGSLIWNVFRYYEPSPATGPCFVAVRRDRCRVVVTRPAQEAENLLLWWNSSEFARRGRCRECGTSLVMDFQWFEPNTVWLIRPSWTKVSFSFSHFFIFCLLNSYFIFTGPRWRGSFGRACIQQWQG